MKQAPLFVRPFAVLGKSGREVFLIKSLAGSASQNVSRSFGPHVKHYRNGWNLRYSFAPKLNFFKRAT